MSTAINDFIGRVGRGRVLLVALLTVLAVGVGITVYVLLTNEDTYEITAEFTSTPGLYADNAVDILGVPTGQIESVTPHSDYVTVKISLPTSVKIPAGAKAVLMAPNPVSDRFVELDPAYTGGPTLQNHDVIPLSRTVVPLELDDVYSSVDTLSKTLGPQGANKGGALSSALHAFAQLADGHGADVHNAINQIAAALPALTAHPDQLKRLITDLDQLTSKLAAHNDTINAVYSDLATSTSLLADDRDALASAVANLQRGLAQVVTYLKANKGNLSASIRDLTTTVQAVVSEQKSLIQTFDIAPLGFQNFNRAITLNGPCLSGTGAPNNCPGIYGRLDLSSDYDAFLHEYCGNIQASLLPVIENIAGVKQNAEYSVCGAGLAALQGYAGPPGSPKTPDLDLSHYLGN